MTALAFLPLLILMIIVLGSGFVGLVFIALMNIGISFGTLYLTSPTVFIPSEIEQSND